MLLQIEPTKLRIGDRITRPGTEDADIVQSLEPIVRSLLPKRVTIRVHLNSGAVVDLPARQKITVYRPQLKREEKV